MKTESIILKMLEKIVSNLEKSIDNIPEKDRNSPSLEQISPVLLLMGIVFGLGYTIDCENEINKVLINFRLKVIDDKFNFSNYMNN